jgi:sucrose-6-phosphate hydrolase SacC (GH32 family)
LEIFVNKGQYVMTAQVFPKEPYKTFKLGDTSPDFHMNNGIIHEVKGVW